MRLSLFFAVFFLCASCFYAVRLYKTNEIPFLNDAIEGFTSAVIGFTPDAVEEKIQKKEAVLLKAKVEEKQPPLAITEGIQDTQNTETTGSVSEMFNATSKNNGSVMIDSGGFYQAARVEVKKPIEEEEVDMFNSAETVDERVSGGPTRFFKARIHNSQPVSNDAQIWLRTDESITLNGKAVPKNFLFKAKANVFGGRIYLHVSEIQSENIEGVNYDDTSNEGIPLSDKHKQGNRLILAEGEPIRFSY